MSPRRTNTNNHDGLNSSCSTHGVTSVPLRPHHVDHPLDEQYLHVSANEHPDESGSDGLPGTEPSARTTHRHTSSNDNARQQKTNGGNQRMMNKNREEDVAGLISENHELRQQTMALSLELADALTKIDELEQQNRKLLKLHEQHRTNNASQEVSSETCLDYQEEMKPARPSADNVNAHQSSGEGMGHLRSSLVGTASVRNIFSSLKGEAEATAPVTATATATASASASATATTTANKRSSLISMARSSIYSGSGRSHQSRHDSHSSISINDESSESLSLHPDDVEGHPAVEADERSSWLQRFSESLPNLNRGEIFAESSALSGASNNSYALPACKETPASMRQPESSGDEFVIPLKEGTGGDGGDAGEGMTRNNTDKDVQDFFRRMSGMENSDGESDAESLAGGENAEWSEFAKTAKTAKTTKTSSAEDSSKRENNFSSIASQLIADATFDLYKSTDGA